MTGKFDRLVKKTPVTEEAPGEQDKAETPQPTRPADELKKYGTYLKPSQIKQLQRYAIEHDLKDYQALGHILDMFFESLEEN